MVEGATGVCGEEPIALLRDVWKVYLTGKVAVPAVRGVSLDVCRGEFLMILGPSGSGKSTLLHLIGGLDKPTRGRVVVEGRDLTRLGSTELALFRRRTVGFVFQQFYLIPRLTALENVEVPMIAEGVPPGRRRERARRLLELVGLGHRIHHKPSELSGGEQQRVAIARALANNPKLLLADEPTGNLDTKSTEVIMNLFTRLNRERGVTIVMVTHNTELTRYAHRVVRMRDGRIVEVEARIATTH